MHGAYWRTRRRIDLLLLEHWVVPIGARRRRRSLLSRFGRLAAESRRLRHPCAFCSCDAGRHRLVLTICGGPPILRSLRIELRSKKKLLSHFPYPLGSITCTSIDSALLKSGLKLLPSASYCRLRRCGPAATSWRIARVLLDPGAHLQLLSVNAWSGGHHTRGARTAARSM